MRSKIQVLAVGALFIVFGALSFACNANHGTTPLAPAVISYGGSLTFNPSAVTIKSGMTVIWDSSFGFFHNLVIDDGASNCVTTYTYPATIAFPAAGTYSFHCAFHSPCGFSSCADCTGMAGTLLVK